MINEEIKVLKDSVGRIEKAVGDPIEKQKGN